MTELITEPVARPKGWLRNLILLWLAWAMIVIVFQKLAATRLQPRRPDKVIGWTASETTATAQRDKIYLIEPFMNEQVSWDSEYYLSIALVGYDDPAVLTDGREQVPFTLNYAFFPIYPLVMRIFAWPLHLLGINWIATATLAGVIVSLLGTLAGIVALYDLAYPGLGHEGATRAIFYLLIFPTGFFLAQVYTEGLFIGLSFSSLALMQYSRKGNRYLWAASILAALATLTRAVGIALVLALAVRLIIDQLAGRRLSWQNMPWMAVLRSLVYAILPVAAYLVWSLSKFGQRFKFVDEHYFGRGALQIGSTLQNTAMIIGGFMGKVHAWQIGDRTLSAIYFSLELIAVIFGLTACLACLRSYPGLAIFSLCAWIIPVFSGSPQSLIRYMLVLPTNYLLLSKLGRNPVFDRAWTIISLLLLGLLATLFSFDFWVA